MELIRAPVSWGGFVKLTFVQHLEEHLAHSKYCVC